jgi:hypothetical protein
MTIVGFDEKLTNSAFDISCCNFGYCIHISFVVSRPLRHAMKSFILLFLPLDRLNIRNQSLFVLFLTCLPYFWLVPVT